MVAFIAKLLNDGFRKVELSSTQKEGVIICIPKGNEEKIGGGGEETKRWRPTSLLNVVHKTGSACNVVYKIGSACIANR